MMRILGIDTGITAPGFVIIDTENNTVLYKQCFKPEAYSAESVIHSNIRRSLLLTRFVQELIATYKPEVAVLEVFRGGAAHACTVRGLLSSAIALITTLTLYEIPVFCVTPDLSKKVVTGNSQASKLGVITAIRDRWGIPSQDLHIERQEAIADAAATICTYLAGQATGPYSLQNQPIIRRKNAIAITRKTPIRRKNAFPLPPTQTPVPPQTKLQKLKRLRSQLSSKRP